MREYSDTFDNDSEERLGLSRSNAVSTDNLVNQIRDAVQSALGVTTYSVDSMLNAILTMDIGDFCDFNERNYASMLRLMRVNLLQSSTTLGTLGTSAATQGLSTSITSKAKAYSYAQGINYTEGFARTEPASSESNVNSTRYQDKGSSTLDYVNHGQLYNGASEPMYPDELGILSKTDADGGGNEYFKTWALDGNRDSILWKTKKLCDSMKFNTLISRFGTQADADSNSLPSKGEAGHRVFGMSHGRNLLTKEAEESPSKYAYLVNGYNNPYCRVWTHHHQYGQVRRMIRPFIGEDGKPIKLEEWHKAMPFRAKGVDGEGSAGGEVGFSMSVLGDNGFVNIAPKFQAEDGQPHPDGNLHTKQCMFSIENLAWRDYSPYEFEKSLSWEQRGPLGGRIMWFPPYGLTFNESSQAKWNTHSFIGRGEDVYTYVNTTRRGNLRFMMVVDNPSVINYFKGRQNASGGDTKDTDILRFFAGCDPFVEYSGGNGDGSASATAPGIHEYPLFDEYTEPEVAEVEVPAPPAPSPAEPPHEDPAPQTVTVMFRAYYPNNYSGCYDANGQVDPILYLLQGKVAQKQGDDRDLPLNFGMGRDAVLSNSGFGYEMSKNGETGVSKVETDWGKAEDFAIVGSEYFWKSGAKYTPSKTKKWYYRIDGEAKAPSGYGSKTAAELEECNYYDQTLSTNNSYKDLASSELNLSTKNGDEQCEYSLAEVATALYELEGRGREEFLSCADQVDRDAVERLKDLFSNYKVDSAVVSGQSNSHGSNADNAVNKARNRHLAHKRAETLMNWLNGFGQFDGVAEKDDDVTESSIGTAVSEEDARNESGFTAKLYRSALATIVLSSEKRDEEASSADDGTAQDVVIESEEISDADENGEREEDAYVLEAKSEDRGEEYGQKNTWRYDKEYFFFRKIRETDPLVWDKLMDKIQYFDPAFHSMTPEGFTDRLSFLHQCTRQGDTIGASDSKARTANNLAFGRPPFCVLRLGDFYNTKILIENMDVQYDPLQWDLNPEGIGVQPLLATINLSIVFIGGSDIGGPIDRLQNAMSFNYYANQRFYDNRADRVKYSHDSGYTNFGGIESYKAHNTPSLSQEKSEAISQALQSEGRKRGGGK